MSPRAKAAVGGGFLMWGAVGLFLSDKAEQRWYTPTQADKDALPRLTVVERGAR
ncbi:hypothetical protein GQ53DRAFT_747994 [Thozetella sp. PMI_491]|nr:hypothetical protein GQ53DRAFT_747994 [Thozetella sp. PMI_491]